MSVLNRSLALLTLSIGLVAGSTPGNAEIPLAMLHTYGSNPARYPE